jgi:muramoyltetrapeptide carboxypeptidase
MSSPLRPNRIQPGATIGVFTPSEPITESREPKVQAGIEYLQDHGYRVVTADNYLKRRYYMAGTVEERVADIHSLLDNDNVDALIASWGGKSANQLLPQLDFDRFRRKRKPVIGFSDSTCLSNAIFAKTGLISFLGPNIIGKLDESEYSDLRFLQSPSSPATLVGRDDSVTTLHSGNCSGRLLGGTLNSFASGVLNSEFEPTLDGCIFILGAGSKTPQLLDQLLTHLVITHKFDRIGGLVLCDLENVKDDRNWGERSPQDVILERFSDLRVPIIHTPVIGHGKRKNPILPIGALCTLDADAGTLVLEEPVVE